MPHRNEAVPHDTEDRGWWYIHGENEEQKFVELCRDRLALNAQINPEKIRNRYAPDLVVNGVVSDLKSQTTPFFSSKVYGLDPRFTVTFNRKDYERYRANYPEIDIYYWINWVQTESDWGKVDYFAGIFFLPFKDVEKLIIAPAPEHHYKRRRDPENKNAKSSFLLDVRSFKCLFSTE